MKRLLAAAAALLAGQVAVAAPFHFIMLDEHARFRAALQGFIAGK